MKRIADSDSSAVPLTHDFRVALFSFIRLIVAARNLIFYTVTSE